MRLLYIVLVGMADASSTDALPRGVQIVPKLERSASKKGVGVGPIASSGRERAGTDLSDDFDELNFDFGDDFGLGYAVTANSVSKDAEELIDRARSIDEVNLAYSQGLTKLVKAENAQMSEFNRMTEDDLSASYVDIHDVQDVARQYTRLRKELLQKYQKKLAKLQSQ